MVGLLLRRPVRRRGQRSGQFRELPRRRAQARVGAVVVLVEHAPRGPVPRRDDRLRRLRRVRGQARTTPRVRARHAVRRRLRRRVRVLDASRRDAHPSRARRRRHRRNHRAVRPPRGGVPARAERRRAVRDMDALDAREPRRDRRRVGVPRRPERPRRRRSRESVGMARPHADRVHPAGALAVRHLLPRRVPGVARRARTRGRREGDRPARGRAQRRPVGRRRVRRRAGGGKHRGREGAVPRGKL